MRQHKTVRSVVTLASVFILGVLLFGCTTAPPPATQEPVPEPTPIEVPSDDPASRLELALADSVPIGGEAASGPDTWPFTITGIFFEPETGAFQAEIEWPSLGAIHLMDGTLIGDMLEFEEIDYIQPGDAILNCQYVAQLVEINGRVEGTWGGCMDYEGTFWIEIP